MCVRNINYTLEYEDNCVCIKFKDILNSIHVNRKAFGYVITINKINTETFDSHMVLMNRELAEIEGYEVFTIVLDNIVKLFSSNSVKVYRLEDLYSICNKVLDKLGMNEIDTDLLDIQYGTPLHFNEIDSKDMITTSVSDNRVYLMDLAQDKVYIGNNNTLKVREIILHQKFYAMLALNLYTNSSNNRVPNSILKIVARLDESRRMCVGR